MKTSGDVAVPDEFDLEEVLKVSDALQNIDKVLQDPAAIARLNAIGEHSLATWAFVSIIAQAQRDLCNMLIRLCQCNLPIPDPKN